MSFQRLGRSAVELKRFAIIKRFMAFLSSSLDQLASFTILTISDRYCSQYNTLRTDLPDKIFFYLIAVKSKPCKYQLRITLLMIIFTITRITMLMKFQQMLLNTFASSYV